MPIAEEDPENNVLGPFAVGSRILRSHDSHEGEESRTNSPKLHRQGIGAAIKFQRFSALVHGSFIGGDLVGSGGKTLLTEHAFQTQRLPPSSYRQDEIQGDELGGVRGWPSSAWQPDPVDDAGGTIVLAGTEADDTRWPATLFPIWRSRPL
jgi:hypothetical protein